MQMGILSLPARQWGRLGLVALLGLTLAVVTVSAGHASGRDAGDAHAVIAKKRCKKKHKRSAGTAKKKKCKKVKHVVLPAPGPLTRATLAWTANDEVDLHAFDSNGNHAGWVDVGVVNNIPNAHHNGDVGPGGPQESFTDDIFVVGGPSNREFAYVACLYDGPASGSYSATFTVVARDGSSASRALDGPGVWTVTVPGGPQISDSQAVSTCGV
jgi:hypothetical protein